MNVRYMRRSEIEIELPSSASVKTDWVGDRGGDHKVSVVVPVNIARALFYKLRDELRAAGELEE